MKTARVICGLILLVGYLASIAGGVALGAWSYDMKFGAGAIYEPRFWDYIAGVFMIGWAVVITIAGFFCTRLLGYIVMLTAAIKEDK